MQKLSAERAVYQAMLGKMGKNHDRASSTHRGAIGRDFSDIDFYNSLVASDLTLK